MHRQKGSKRMHTDSKIVISAKWDCVGEGVFAFDFMHFSHLMVGFLK